MSTTLTPPPQHPVGPQPPAGAQPPAPRRESARVISILAIVVGCVLIAGAIVSGVFSALRVASSDERTLTASADGIAALDVDLSTGDMLVAYGDVEEATLVVRGTGTDDWRLTRDGDTLTVRTDRSWWTGWRLWGGAENEHAALTLPQRYAETPLDAEFSLSAGQITAEGRYGSLDIDMSAGLVTVEGTARELDAHLSAGRLDLELADVRTAEVEVSAGLVQGRITGTQPDAVAIDLSAGSVELVLPNGTYAVSSDVSAGGFDHTLNTSPSASARIDVSVSAGHVVLRPER
ncbi:DUF4097 family beta strand repeat-containing protein [Microbacterium sp. No. 7]|uniref:DUF4097 family beta strand repeat-containing protein n=1 Tax=Microbacterium sp. No. 7 TaxID=1714373 RepID=UPI0006ED3E32|nr:DUF4097 family beta strand repeat-containing protein [Microbacterium sp. No. 7]ALJ21580.1 hypothetical protein AOA12_17445 [Microbacterium sp. No. 7]